MFNVSRDIDHSPRTRFSLIRTFAASAALVIMTIASAPAALAGSGDWYSTSVVGSSGTPDERGRKKVEFVGPAAQIKESADSGKVVLRYPMLSDTFFGVGTKADRIGIQISYRDNGPEARVVARLKSYDRISGTVRLHLTFDSNEEDPSDDLEKFSHVLEGQNLVFLYGEIFYLEVTLHKTSSEGDPAVGFIRGTIRQQ